jgi:hypothetical protein
MINLGAVLFGIQELTRAGDELRLSMNIGIALALAAALWFLGPRRYAARSFAVGVLLAAAMLHANGGYWMF